MTIFLSTGDASHSHVLSSLSPTSVPASGSILSTAFDSTPVLAFSDEPEREELTTAYQSITITDSALYSRSAPTPDGFGLEQQITTKFLSTGSLSPISIPASESISSTAFDSTPVLAFSDEPGRQELMTVYVSTIFDNALDSRSVPTRSAPMTISSAVGSIITSSTTSTINSIFASSENIIDSQATSFHVSLPRSRKASMKITTIPLSTPSIHSETGSSELM